MLSCLSYPDLKFIGAVRIFLKRVVVFLLSGQIESLILRGFFVSRGRPDSVLAHRSVLGHNIILVDIRTLFDGLRHSALEKVDSRPTARSSWFYIIRIVV